MHFMLPYLGSVPMIFSRCKYYPGAVGKGRTIELTCSNPVAGRYVFIRLKVKEYLTLCEVEVYTLKGQLLL